MRRRRLAKATAAVLALLVQAGGVALLMLERAPDARPEGELIRIRVLPLTPLLVRPEPPPEPPPATPRVTRPAIIDPSAAPPGPPAMPPAPAAEDRPRGITPAPDWYAEAEAVARRRVEQDALRARRGEALDSKPDVLVLPGQPPPDDRVVRLPNGDIQTRTRTSGGDIVCTHSQPALDEIFSPWAKHRPAKCTVRPKPAASLDGLEALKPRYLRSPPASGAAAGESP